MYVLVTSGEEAYTIPVALLLLCSVGLLMFDIYGDRLWVHDLRVQGLYKRPGMIWEHDPCADATNIIQVLTMPGQGGYPRTLASTISRKSYDCSLV